MALKSDTRVQRPTADQLLCVFSAYIRLPGYARRCLHRLHRCHVRKFNLFVWRVSPLLVSELVLGGLSGRNYVECDTTLQAASFVYRSNAPDRVLAGMECKESFHMRSQ